MWLDATPVLTHPPTDQRGVRLSAEETGWLRHGVSLSAPALSAHTADRHTLITVHRALFPMADFQEEGPAAALLLWLEQELNLPPHPVGVTFDQAANRYVYDWAPPA